MGLGDQKLRTEKLTLYEKDLERIDRCIEEFLRLSSAKCAILVDKDGHLVTSRGEFPSADLDTITALVAGSFASTRLLAQILGEEQFHSLYNQGTTEHLLVWMVGERALLSILFDGKTTLGMVRLYAAEAAKRMASIFEESKQNTQAQGDQPTIDPEFSSSASSKMDELFNEED